MQNCFYYFSSDPTPRLKFATKVASSSNHFVSYLISRAATGSGHLDIAWAVSRADAGTSALYSLSMHNGFARHAKVVSGVAAGTASSSWLYTNLCTFRVIPRWPACTL
eukprot:4467980-Pleurochrysis_carterae.AAC.2